ncbi:MAG: ATP-binding protein [Cyclobacteriaceae bacterium]|nr:ATP-binding protein [Cyclobacteriaceae bacterium]
MLVEFSVGNFLSFKEKKTLSLEASSIKENPDNVILRDKLEVLRSAVIYGANSSGKSNLIKAMSTMSSIVRGSGKYNSSDEIPVTPFLLSTETETQPSFFEVLFIIENDLFRYGFEVDKKSVQLEWLFQTLSGEKEQNLFIRQLESIEISNEFEEARGVEDKTRDNALFLSIVDQFNGPIAKKIIEWFSKQVNFSGLQHEQVKFVSSLLLEHKDLNTWIKDFLLPLDLGFKDFEFDEKEKRVITYHTKFDESGSIVDERFKFDLLTQESAGTNKLYDMAGRLSLGLLLGGVTIIDELDAKLHPLLTMAIVKLFNSPKHNKNNAQLIFATHDTNLLSHGCFRRDQIYFTEKTKLESTDLYSLVEYRETDGTKVRNDRSYEKDYIAGRYRAIPFMGDFSKLTKSWQE